MATAKVWKIEQMFDGLPKDDDLKLVVEDLPELKDGGRLIALQKSVIQLEINLVIRICLIKLKCLVYQIGLIPGLHICKTFRCRSRGFKVEMGVDAVGCEVA